MPVDRARPVNELHFQDIIDNIRRRRVYARSPLYSLPVPKASLEKSALIVSGDGRCIEISGRNEGVWNRRSEASTDAVPISLDRAPREARAKRRGNWLPCRNEGNWISDRRSDGRWTMIVESVQTY